MKSLACISLLLLVAGSMATKFSDCGSKTGQVTKVDVTDCPDDMDPCILKRGTTKTINISFQSKTQTNAVKAVVHGVIGGVPLPFALENNDGCKDSGLACPLQNGQGYTYNSVLEIKHSYPPLSVKVRWELQDQNGSDIVCIEIPCHLQ